jgi:CyaY protein
VGERNAVEAELSALALQVLHGEEGAVGCGGAGAAGVGCPGGSLSGPFWPHAASREARARIASARIMGGIMTESDFHRAVDAALARIEASVEAQGELDTDLEGGVLTITCPDASRIIVNRQTPNREIWIAARSGGFHFASREGAWRDTRSGEELFAALARLIEQQASVRVRWS